MINKRLKFFLSLENSLALLITLLICPPAVFAQATNENTLFETDEVLQIMLSGKVQDAINDRADKSSKHTAVLGYKTTGNITISIPVQLQTRGNFRRMRSNCKYPPLWIHFSEDSIQLNSVFSQQKKAKLVMPCGNDEYVIREWLVYKLFNLLTPLSFHARLVQVTIDDQDLRRPPPPFYAILLEEEKQMARRNNMTAVESKIKPQQTSKEEFLLATVFEYLVGNTDWSVQYLHNIKLLAKDSFAVPVAVPYDFDHSGMVSAPYAKPAEELRLRSVTERRYRGYCITDIKEFQPVIARFNNLKTEIYKLYSDCKLIDSRYLKFVNTFLDEFYETINDKDKWQKEFSYPCDRNGTGNIVIKGLKEN